MSNADRIARINEAYHLVERIARAVARGTLPRGITLDDLCSLGGEELCKAADKYATDGAGRPWLPFAGAWLKFRYRDFIRTSRRRANRTSPLEIETADGDSFPRPDKKAKDPADRASARESRAAGQAALVNAAMGAALPPPDEAAVKASDYRNALHAAVQPADLGGLLKAMLQQGLGGDVAAARLVFNVMQPAGPPPPQPAINVRVVLPGDDDDE